MLIAAIDMSRRSGNVLAAVIGIGASLWAPCSCAEYRWNFPEPVTPIARDTLQVHNEFMLVITVLFVVVFAIMIYSMIRHRKREGHLPAGFTGPRSTLGWVWVLLPFCLLVYIDFVLMGIPAFQAVIHMEDTRTKADMVVKVTGMQWKWQYEYPDSGIKFLSVLTTPADQINNQQAKGEHYLLEVDNPLVLPVGKKVRILLTSTDVIHSWWVPQFGVKRDAIPGFLRETWVKIDKPGTYRGQCSELCGIGHGFMPVVVKALPEAEYVAWVDATKKQQAAATQAGGKVWTKEQLMAQGKSVYERICVACHQPSGQGLPPAFPALAGSKVINQPLFAADGKPAKDSHLDRVMNGKPGTAMQAFKETLSDVEIAGVVTYERNSFGNAMGDMVQPGQVKANR